MKRIGLLVTGNEVLLGKTKDTNGPYIAQSLLSKGIEVAVSVVAGDTIEDLVRALNFLSQASDVVIITGGLGATIDDLTAQAVSSFSEIPLQFSDAAWRVSTDYFKRISRDDVPVTNRKQAMLPAGSRIFPNIHGTAAGFVCEFLHQGCDFQIYCLPGVPREMETMFLQFVLPELAVTNEIMFTRSWNIFLLSESIIGQKLFELQTLVRQLLPESRISYQAHLGYVTWSITVPVITSEQERVAKILEDEVTAGLRAALGDYILYSDERSCHDYFVSEMSSRNLSFSCAESCTGGLMSSEITSVSGSSRMFLGGVVSYSSTSKSDLLGVEPRALDRFGAVSTQVAAQMAFGVRSAFSSDVAISVTGVAGPGGGTTVHPVGSVCFGMAISLLRIVNLQELVRVLAVFGWTPVARNHEGFVKQKSIELVAERKFGAGLSRDDIQHRSTIFAIGSVIAILNMLK